MYHDCLRVHVFKFRDIITCFLKMYVCYKYMDPVVLRICLHVLPSFQYNQYLISRHCRSPTCTASTGKLLFRLHVLLSKILYSETEIIQTKLQYYFAKGDGRFRKENLRNAMLNTETQWSVV